MSAKWITEGVHKFVGTAPGRTPVPVVLAISWGQTPEPATVSQHWDSLQ